MFSRLKRVFGLLVLVNDFRASSPKSVFMLEYEACLNACFRHYCGLLVLVTDHQAPNQLFECMFSRLKGILVF